MSIPLTQLGPLIAATTTLGGLIFQIGKHSEKLDIIGLKVEAQEKKDFSNNQTICDIHNTTIQNRFQA